MWSSVEMQVSKNELDLGQGYFYYKDAQALSQASRTIRQAPVELNRASGSRLTGRVTAGEEQMLLLSVPYDTGWRVKVDGEAVAAETVLDCLMAVPVTAGTHTFELRFLPRGIVPGCTLLAAALLWTVFLHISQEKKNRK